MGLRAGTRVQAAAASYGYDSMGRIASATDFKGQKTVYTYDDIGRLEYVSIYNTDAVPEAVLNLAYTYDTKGNVSIVEATTCSSGCGEEFNYTYDGDRNLLESRDGVDDLGSVEYEYDGADRLSILEYPIEWDTSSPPTVTDTFQREYAYDLANRVTEVRDGETSAPFADDGFSVQPSLSKEKAGTGSALAILRCPHPVSGCFVVLCHSRRLPEPPAQHPGHRHEAESHERDRSGFRDRGDFARAGVPGERRKDRPVR
jgi:YD repeat-containing protein